MEPLQLAVEAAKEAGQLLNENFRHQHTVKAKSRHEVVSEQDVLSEKLILSKIREVFPNHSILSEEKGSENRESEYLWLVDPLDGTSNYLMGNPLFAVSIALLHHGKPIVGVVYAPFTDELFTAEIGKGAFLNGKSVKPSEVAKLDESMVTYCHGHSADAMNRAIDIYVKLKSKCRDVRQLGAAALELAFVAMGRTECILIPGVHPWDVAAASLLVTEAGGKLSDFDGKPWTIDSEDILGSNSKIHNEILELLP
jgi:myo-inositol-1(or 4)-monophosphatase